MIDSPTASDAGRGAEDDHPDHGDEGEANSLRRKANSRRSSMSTSRSAA